MSIKFTSVKSKEVVVAETEPHIAAMWASSDRSPNVSQGQDMGWRLHPDVAAELDEIKHDGDSLERVARMRKKEVNELTEYDILSFISQRANTRNEEFDPEVDYSDDYELEVRAAKKRRASARQKSELGLDDEEATEVAVADPSQLSDDELLAELERRSASTTTTTVKPRSTTTTTSAPAKA